MFNIFSNYTNSYILIKLNKLLYKYINEISLFNIQIYIYKEDFELLDY